MGSTYKIHDQTLQQTNNARYLASPSTALYPYVVNPHIEAVTKKANNTVSFLRRNLSTYAKDVKETCYKSLVRPQLEYAASVWDPHTKSNINKVESVKQRLPANDQRHNYDGRLRLGAATHTCPPTTNQDCQPARRYLCSINTDP